MLKYNPNDHFHLNAKLLVIGVIMGIILGFTFESIFVLILVPLISQYKWLIDVTKRIIYPSQIKALDWLTNSANLADNKDNYSVGRYRNAVTYTLDMTNAWYYLLKIDARGVRNTRRLQDLAYEVGAAFQHPAYLQDVTNGSVEYRIDLTTVTRSIHESDF